MSKYKSYGKNRASNRAGLHFDKLLKACSNSKKPPTAMAAGALGRFGVAQFTSTRGCLDSTGEDDQEKPSRFSSFKKRPRLESSDLKTMGSSMPALPPALDPFMSPLVHLNSTPTQTVLKPRKFFKSRGPMEVEVDPNQPVRIVPTHILPSSPMSSNPILGSNQSNIQNFTHSSSYYSHQDRKGNPDTCKSSTYVSPSAKNTNSFNSVCSPPIKLRIIKDKATSKFMSVSDSIPLPVVNSSQPDTPVKTGKKRGRKSKEEKLAMIALVQDKVVKQKTPKKVKEPKVKLKPQKPVKVSVPKRSSGRVTRSTIKLNDNDDSAEGDGDDVGFLPAGQENLHEKGRNSEPLAEGNYYADNLHVPPQDTLKKLEEDVEFQKLSQMLSSMEEENGSASASQQQQVKPEETYNSFPSRSSTDFDYQNQPSTSQQEQSLYSSGNSFPMNLSCSSGSSGSTNDLSSQSLSNLNPTFLTPSHSQISLGKSRSDRIPSHEYLSPRQAFSPEKKVPDIRSILEDDWNESFEEESPRKMHGHHGGASTSNQSPPKVSRFDASAFMSQQQSDVSANQSHPQEDDREEKQTFPDNIQRPIPVYGNQIPNPHQHHPPMFNINSSPYAMRNLLGGSGEAGFRGPALEYEDNSNENLSDEPENLVCPKIPVKLDEMEKPQEAVVVNVTRDMSSQESLGESSLSGSQNSQNNGQPQLAALQSTKKASIFKSRSKIVAGESTGVVGKTEGTVKKRHALYKHTFGQQEKQEEGPVEVPQPAGALFGDYDDFGDEEEGNSDLKLRKLRIANSSSGYSSRLIGVDDSVNKVLCKKESKKLFTVVRNVKAGHELQESGEFHEFDGDVWYILEDLKDKNSINNRCLSAITLAQRCMDQAFRMHLRAHGTVSEFCKELYDAPQHPALALLAATVLFVLSQDRLNMDLDTESLKLILALTKAEPVSEIDLNENNETAKNRQRVVDLCCEMKNRGHAKHLMLEKITASELALETLLYLTSKRAGEWVKHELRALGGLDSIVGEVDGSFNWVKAEIVGMGWTEDVIERLRKIDRCLQVLQQVTFNHEDNQRYLMQVSTRDVDGGTVKCTDASPAVFLELFKFCRNQLAILQVQLEASSVVREVLFSILRLLVNLSHDYRGIVIGSEIMLGMDGFLELALHSTFQMSSHFPDEKVFDLLMHSLCLLLNLVEYSKKNRAMILQSMIRRNATGSYIVGNPTDSFNDSDDSGVEEELPLLDALIHMFLCRERSAKKEEQHTDNILTKGPDSEGSSGNSSNNTSQKDPNSQDQEGSSVQDTIDKLIQTAGKHMENSLIAAYISLLIGYLIMDDQVSVEQVRISMPDQKFLPLMVVLKKLFNFMSITSSASGSLRGLKATAIALKFYAKADPSSNEELKKIIPD